MYLMLANIISVCKFTLSSPFFVYISLIFKVIVTKSVKDTAFASLINFWTWMKLCRVSQHFRGPWCRRVSTSRSSGGPPLQVTPSKLGCECVNRSHRPMEQQQYFVKEAVRVDLHEPQTVLEGNQTQRHTSGRIAIGVSTRN